MQSNFQTTNPKAYWWSIGDQEANAGLSNRKLRVPEEYRMHYEKGYCHRLELIAEQRRIQQCIKEQDHLTLF